MLEGRQRVVAVAANVNWQTRDQKRVTLASLFCWDMLVGPLFVCFQSSLKRTLSHFQLKLSDSTFLPFTVGKMNHAEEANVSAAPHVVAEEASDHWREACSFECSTRSCELHCVAVNFCHVMFLTPGNLFIRDSILFAVVTSTFMFRLIPIALLDESINTRMNVFDVFAFQFCRNDPLYTACMRLYNRRVVCNWSSSHCKLSN